MLSRSENHPDPILNSVLSKIVYEAILWKNGTYRNLGIKFNIKYMYCTYFIRHFFLFSKQ
jgi:hypothetical protein